MPGERELDAILTSLDAAREPGVVVVAQLAEGEEPPATTRAWIREREGLTVVLAGHDHDHILVPVARADDALAAIRSLRR